MRPAKLTTPFLFAAMLVLPGCAVFSDAPHYRGIAVSRHDIKELTPGLSRQDDVEAVLGPPTFIPPFNQNDWVYVAQVTKMRIGRTEGVNSQNVVVVAFNSDGTLKSVTEKNLKSAIPASMEQHTTPVPGGSAGFIQQLIGGVGSYNPLGAAQDTSAGAATPGANVGSSGSSGTGF